MVELAREACAWLKTPEGRAAIKKALAEAAEACRQRRESTKLTWEQLNRPCTI